MRIPNLCLLSSLTILLPLAVYGADLSRSETGNEEMFSLQESRPLVARTGAWQTYSDHIQIKPGQEKRRLLITFINGADGRAKLTDVDVHLARKPFAIMRDFSPQGELTCDLTGKVRVGDNLLTTRVFGPSGARIVWKLATPKVAITAVKPNPFTLIDEVVIEGKNFSNRTHNIKVLVAGKPVKVVHAKDNELELKLPPALPGGEQDLVVVADALRSDVFRVHVKANPQITWVNFLATPPGQPVVISGKGFSKIPSENSVTFGLVKSHIISTSETSITCVVPEMTFPRWHVPIVVTTNGMPSKERLTINVDQRVIPNEGLPQL